MLLRKRIDSFRHATKGIHSMFSSQANAVIHLLAALVVMIAGWYCSLSPTEWCLVILAISMVIGAEAMNTAIEHLTDLISPQYHLLAGKAKDIAAGAVLIAALGALAIGIIIFGPKMMQLF